MSLSVSERMEQVLHQRASEQALRRLYQAPDHLIDFCSNDYLGLAQSPVLHHAVQQALAHRAGHWANRLTPH